MTFEEGNLEHEVEGIGGDAGVGGAHDAGDDDRVLSVGDDEHTGGKGALFFVEGGDFFALGSVTDDDLAVGEFSGVEGVHGLAVFEHHVVSDIDDVVDRTEPDGGETLLHPVGGRLDGDAGDDGGGVERAIGVGEHADRGEQIGARVG